MNIVEWMISEKIAENGFAASHISNGLQLPKYDRETQKKMCRSYRNWRRKTDKKNDIPTWQAFQLVVAGIEREDVLERQIDMFEEALK
jgi:hypothetical protein